MARNELMMLEFLCVDVPKVSRFWSQLLEIPLESDAGSDAARLDPPGAQPAWVFLKSDAGGNSGFMIALTSYDLDEDAARAVTLGATGASRHTEDSHEWIEMRDPEGHRFTFNLAATD